MSMRTALHFDTNGVEIQSSFGQEIHDLTPVAYPIKIDPREPLWVRLRRMLQAESQIDRTPEGYETFDDANDFDLDGVDLSDRITPFQETFLRSSAAHAEAIEKKAKEPVPPLKEKKSDPVPPAPSD